MPMVTVGQFLDELRDYFRQLGTDRLELTFETLGTIVLAFGEISRKYLRR
jgi:hypothetical protein